MLNRNNSRRRKRALVKTMVTVEKVLNDIEKNQMAPVYLVLGEEQVNAEKIKQKLIANFQKKNVNSILEFMIWRR